jgi:hypothetical protein
MPGQQELPPPATLIMMALANQLNRANQPLPEDMKLKTGVPPNVGLGAPGKAGEFVARNANNLGKLTKKGIETFVAKHGSSAKPGGSINIGPILDDVNDLFRRAEVQGGEVNAALDVVEAIKKAAQGGLSVAKRKAGGALAQQPNRALTRPNDQVGQLISGVQTQKAQNLTNASNMLEQFDQEEKAVIFRLLSRFFPQSGRNTEAIINKIFGEL